MNTLSCPNCESERLFLVSTRDGSWFFDHDSGALIGQTIYIFECECGRRFAHAERKRSEPRTMPQEPASR